jgi:hypothetical protein
MIYFSFNITNPFVRKFKSYNKLIKVSKNKTLDLEFTKDNTIIFFYFRLSARESHAGLCLYFGLLGYSIGLEFSDDRHWDMEKGTWEEIE